MVVSDGPIMLEPRSLNTGQTVGLNSAARDDAARRRGVAEPLRSALVFRANRNVWGPSDIGERRKTDEVLGKRSKASTHFHLSMTSSS